MNRIIFPYGRADFYSIRMENNFYIDRTAYIRFLEERGHTLLFLRPRRFGKSLLLSVLENYYDVGKSDDFERLFGELAIGQNLTSRHNRYFILRWNFSAVLTQGSLNEIRQSLYNHINRSIERFAIQYKDWLQYPVVVAPDDALSSFQSLLAVIQSTPYKLYLLIDEYDNFANEVLMAEQSSSLDRYQDLVEGEGILKTLFKVVKYALEGLGLERVFITGVSPVLAKDLTSGFNIIKNITLESAFYDLCGFHEAEVVEVLDQLRLSCGFTQQQAEEMLTVMRTFYNGYRFGYNDEPLLYNPTLVLYFLEHLQENGTYPREILDNNLVTDRQKIIYVARMPYGKEVIASALNDEHDPPCISQLANRFGAYDILHGPKDETFIISLLYYLGVLTFGGYTPEGKITLHIPNLVIRKLYVEQFKELLLPPTSLNQSVRVAEHFYSSGDMASVCQFIEQNYFPVFDNRDYRWTNELTIKTIFLTLLFNDTFYIMDSEPALQRGYADLIMIIRPDMRRFRLYDFLIECKYVSLTEVGMSGEMVRGKNTAELALLEPVRKQHAIAQEQLARYRAVLDATYGESLRLRCYSVVAVGYERLVWQEELKGESR